jgi:uncharacterized protein
VTNIVAFGCFVDVGVHQDGLVHVSQLADRFVKDPNEVVRVGQKVKVTVQSVDLPRNRIALSMRNTPAPAGAGRGGAKRDGGAATSPKPAPKPAPQPAPAPMQKPADEPKTPGKGFVAPNGMRFR